VLKAAHDAEEFYEDRGARISIWAGRSPPRPDTLKRTDQPPISTKPLADGAGHRFSTQSVDSSRPLRANSGHCQPGRRRGDTRILLALVSRQVTRLTARSVRCSDTGCTWSLSPASCFGRSPRDSSGIADSMSRRAHRDLIRTRRARYSSEYFARMFRGRASTFKRPREQFRRLRV
jgi:hypothetical protein